MGSTPGEVLFLSLRLNHRIHPAKTSPLSAAVSTACQSSADGCLSDGLNFLYRDEEHDENHRNGVTPECFYRGSSSGFAWIPAKNMRE